MKMKLIAAASLALCSSLSFAATAKLACDPSTPLEMINTCAPEAQLFIGGSSALGGALTTVVPADLFDTSKPLITVVDGAGSSQSKEVSAWYGMSLSALTGGVSKRLFVVYNKNNGSAAGVSMVMAKTDPKNAKGTNIAESQVVAVGPVAGARNSCIETAGGTLERPKFTCTSTAWTQADLAISDVHSTELYALYSQAAKAKVTDYTQKPLALQGFGIAVNWNFYQALQRQNIADKLIADTCEGTVSAACQPSIRSSDYATLISKNASSFPKSAAIFVSGDATALNLARRDDLSGTQASSNIFFANNACGIVPAKSKGLGGGLQIAGALESVAGKLTIDELAVSGDVTTRLNSSVGYAIGAVGLGSSQDDAVGKWKWVRIDGQSPNYNPDGTKAYKNRTQFANGNYPFAMVAFGIYPNAFFKKPVAGSYKLQLSEAVIAGLRDSTLHDLTGVAYIDGVADTDAAKPKQSKVTRLNGNNCSPLIRP